MKYAVSLIVLVMLIQAVPARAAATTFTVSATIPDPPATVSISVDSINSSSGAFTQEPTGTTALSFDPMTLNPSLNIYLPDHYFAVNFIVTGGAGRPDVTVSYNEGANPNNGGANPAGLGTKATATFAEETVGTDGSTTETLLTAHGPKKRLIDLSGEHVAFSELVTGSYLRVYLGVWTGSTASPADPSNGQPFSSRDEPGTYTGSLVATAVVD